MERMTTLKWVAIAATLLAAGSGCKKSPTSPDTGAPGASGATITISNTGAVSPKAVTISVGQSVTFVNNDVRSHDMTSDPHPEHTDCPASNAVGSISPGQTKITNAFGTARACGFHDHGDPDNANLKGTITIR